MVGRWLLVVPCLPFGACLLSVVVCGSLRIVRCALGVVRRTLSVVNCDSYFGCGSSLFVACF